jgi:hypothetical protein
MAELVIRKIVRVVEATRREIGGACSRRSA